uniref:Uncharacterized protein n=1 Tax=Utricularia reniformis TaxID=192314 RepID=A0A1Y0B1I1_9LAMI|nr:hypothetical protein AEK19_MT0999 [Utricularia reniformis]ART31223.1 hypothetical protein AEK19_MT0999 [Utricularia reniformis]
MQRHVEMLTLSFEVENLFKCCPDLLAILIQKDLPSAKEFILRGSEKNSK